jgi:hypothetical protein
VLKDCRSDFDLSFGLRVWIDGWMQRDSSMLSRSKRISCVVPVGLGSLDIS